MSESQPITSARELVRIIRHLGLLAEDQITAIAKDLITHTDSARVLVDSFVEQGALTSYQADALLGGDGNGLILDQYVLLEPRGEGGMGTVFKARHRLMNRMVALKRIRSDTLDQESAVARFQREIQALAKLSHPNIVTAHDAEIVNEELFLVMEYCDGPTLKELAAACPLAISDACDYLRQTALGLQHAHENDIIHRDLKPANLIVTSQTAIDGANIVVKILDLGLTRLLSPHAVSSADTATGTNVLMGTPDYIAPEQARDARAADIRSDLYSLGCTLYYALTGRPPFPGGTVVEKILRHQTEQPPPLDRIRSDVPREVIGIVERLMQKNPADRYASPAELAAALLPFVGSDQRTVIDHHSDLLREEPHHPTTIAPSRPIHTSEKNRAGDHTLREYPKTKEHPETSNRRRRVSPFRFWVVIVLGLLCVTSLTTVLVFLVSSGTNPTSNIQRKVEHPPIKPKWKNYVQLKFPKVTPDNEPSSFSPQEMSFSPDGATLAIGYGNYLNSPSSGAVVLWDVATGTIKKVLKDAPRGVLCTAFSPDGKWLVGACGTGYNAVQMRGEEIVLWKMPEAIPVAMFKGHIRSTYAIVFSSDGRYLYTTGKDGRILRWDVANSFKEHGEFPRVTSLRATDQRVEIISGVGRIYTIALSPDDKELAVAGENWIKIWNLKERRFQREWTSRFGGHVVTLKYSPDGKLLIGGTSTRQIPGATAAEIMIADLRTGNCRSLEVKDRAHVCCLTFDKSGKQFLTTHWGGRFQFWDTNSKSLLSFHSWPEWENNYIFFAEYSPNGKFLAVACESRNVLLFTTPVRLKGEE